MSPHPNGKDAVLSFEFRKLNRWRIRTQSLAHHFEGERAVASQRPESPPLRYQVPFALLVQVAGR